MNFQDIVNYKNVSVANIVRYNLTEEEHQLKTLVYFYLEMVEGKIMTDLIFENNYFNCLLIDGTIKVLPNEALIRIFETEIKTKLQLVWGYKAPKTLEDF